MKSCGRLVGTLAIVALIVLFITTVVNYSVYAAELAESREDLEESIEEHEDDCDSRNCSTCDNYEEREKSLNRQSTQIFVSSVQTFLIYGVFCGILYAVGEIVTRLANTAKTDNKQPYSAAPSTSCAICGSPIKAGTFFCGTCGTRYGNGN